MNVNMGENGQSDHLSFINFSGCHLYCFYEVNFKWLERQRKNYPKLKILMVLKSAHPKFLENHCPN